MAGFFFLGGPLTKCPPHQEAAEAIRGGFELSWTQQYYNSKRHTAEAEDGEGEIGYFPLGSGQAQSLGFDEQPGLGLTTTIAKGGLGGGMNCQDCGNQAKKDCAHMRCRTCCKSRGLPCETHVKSTWVPAAKRRERQQQLAAMQLAEREQEEQHGFQIENPKRPRDHHQNDNNQLVLPAASLVPVTASGYEVTEFPAELNSSALFRCVRVSNMDDSDEEYAYQTAVNIGGHVFKGVLYDQGLDNAYPAIGDGSSGGGSGTQPPLNFITGAATSTAAAATSNPNTTALMDPSLVYPAPFNAFMAGTQFFPPPKS